MKQLNPKQNQDSSIHPAFRTSNYPIAALGTLAHPPRATNPAAGHPRPTRDWKIGASTKACVQRSIGEIGVLRCERDLGGPKLTPSCDSEQSVEEGHLRSRSSFQRHILQALNSCRVGQTSFYICLGGAFIMQTFVDWSTFPMTLSGRPSPRSPHSRLETTSRFGRMPR